MRPLFWVPLGAALFLSPGTSLAADDATAQRLFDEGIALMNAGDGGDASSYEKACQKFKASDQVSPSGGALLNLARCYEKIGKLASAWAKYQETADRAASAGKTEVVELAHKKVREIAGQFSSITIVVPKDVPGLVVKKNGERIPKEAWGTTLPVDGGHYTIRAEAPNHEPHVEEIDVPPARVPVRITIPELVRDEKLPPPKPVLPPEEPEQPSSGSGQRTLGLAIAGVGVVGLGIGTVFGLLASGSKSDAEAACLPGESYPSCSTQGFRDANENAKTEASVSTVGFAAGAVLLVGGGVLFFTAPKKSSESAATFTIAPHATRSGGGVGIVGRF